MFWKFPSGVQLRSLSSHSISKLLRTSEVSELTGKSVHVSGWITSVRDQKEFTFLHLTDGLSPRLLQVVIPKNCGIDVDNCSVFASVEVTGSIVPSPKKGQLFELAAESVKVLSNGVSNPDYPFNARSTEPPEYTRKFLHLRSKTPSFASTLRLRSLLTSSIHNYFRNNDFVFVHTPVLTSNDCEGGGETFTVKPESPGLCSTMAKEGKSHEEAYFDKKVFLTVSGQLHLEAVCSGLSKVYNFNHAFRAENSRTRRHLAEFLMVEAELAFAHKISDIIEVMEGLIKYTAQTLLEQGTGDVMTLEMANKVRIKEHLNSVADASFETITYQDAIKMLLENSSRFQSKPIDGDDFGKEHEVFITQHCGNRPTFVVDWPAHLKPFYARRCEGTEDWVSAVDLLVPEVGELCGGSLREFNYETLRGRLEKHGLLNQLSWYADLRRHGSSPTGGFGLGFERLISYLLKISHIRDSIPFPRWPHNCDL